ncbi:MAG: TIM barrel protein [Lentisphaeria bacterium]|nr:TIM barrel protein [Lentisphaeria bacterium]
MKYGVADYGMNVWDGGNYDLEERLSRLKAIGYNGIERLESTDAAETLYKAAVFRRLGMDFATVRMNNPAQSITASAAMGRAYTWLAPGSCGRDVPMDTFVHRAKTFCAACAKYDLAAAIHNHLGQVVESQDELDYFMAKVPEASLLLDIGHLAGAGGNVMKTLEKYYDRIAAIHFKDIFFKDEKAEKWTDRLRFCELGAGSKPGFVDWQGVAEFLRKKKYAKWVLVEHDTHLRDPFIDLKISLDALKKIME